jgi:hypothetical protein
MGPQLTSTDESAESVLPSITDLSEMRRRVRFVPGTVITRRAHPKPSGEGNGHPQDPPYVRDWYERRAASGFGDVKIGRDTGAGARR